VGHLSIANLEHTSRNTPAEHHFHALAYPFKNRKKALMAGVRERLLWMMATPLKFI